MIPHRLLRRGILGALALCGTWGSAAQPIEIVNGTLFPGRASSDATVAGLALEIAAGTVSTPMTGFHQVPVRPGEKLVVTPPPGSDPFELDAVLEMDLGQDGLGQGRTERWSLRFKFGEESSVLAAVSTSPNPRLACPHAGNILTIREGKSDQDRRSLGSPASPESLGASSLSENKARTDLPPGGATLAAAFSQTETQAAGNASPDSAPSGPAAEPRAKAAPIAMFRHTFPDLRPIFFPGPAGPVTVTLPYPYQAVDPAKTRLFFQGEALLIDPKASPFDFYVTHPLRPCIFGRILDPGTKRSIVFHKYAVHHMRSLHPLFKQLAPSDPKLLQASLFTCEPSAQLMQAHAPHYGGKTHIQELNAVRAFLVKEFGIPAENIERRYLKDSVYKAMPDLGQYEQAPITVGATRTGEIFNTSLFACDFFGLGDTPTAPKIRRAKDGAQTFKALPPLDKHMATQQVITCIHGLVKKHYDPGLKRNPYWTRDFFSAEDRLNVPAAALGGLLQIRFENTEVSSVRTLPVPSAKPADTSAASPEGKSEKKQNKKKKTAGSAAAAAAGN